MRQSRLPVVFGACLVQFTIIGLLFCYGLFIKPLGAEFGWSRTLLSGAASLATLTMGVMAIPAGRLNDRFGPRPVLLVTGLSYATGFVLLSYMTAPWQLYLIFVSFVGVGMSTHDVVTLSTIARWFEARRGIMSGVVKVGTALGQMVVPPVAALLLIWIGWRDTFLVLGLVAGVLLVVAALLMRRPPVTPLRADDGIAPALGQSFAEARRSRVFWTMCVVQFLFFPAMMAVPLHLAPHGMDLGMSAARAATLLSVMGGASIAGRLLVGGLVDRIGGKTAMALCFVLLASTLAGLALVSAQSLLFAVVAVYGFCHGGLFTVVSPLVAEYFGMRAHGAIFGTVLFFGTLGGAIGPIAVGWVYDNTGSYQFGFVGLAGLAIFGLLLVLSLPGRRRQALAVAV